MKKKIFIYSILFGIILSLLSALVVTGRFDSNQGSIPVMIKNYRILNAGGCYGNIYKTGFPFSYNEINMSTCDSHVPKINSLSLTLDFIFYFITSFIVISLLFKKNLEKNEKIVRLISVILAVILGLVLVIFLLIINNFFFIPEV